MDDRAIGTGTTVRFGLLIVLLVATTSSMTARLTATGSWLCMLAAGWDPDRDAGANFVKLIEQRDKLDQCIARYEPPAPWWLPVAWMAGELLCVAILFVALPRWKSSRRDIVGVEVFDPSGDLDRQLRALVEQAGLARAPRFVINRAALSCGAVVFGRTGAPTVCLDGGLIASRNRARTLFRAVVLHELAHIHNRDITRTYLTVALWRVFIALVLLPYTAFTIQSAWGLYARRHTIAAGGEMTMVIRGLVLVGFLTLLVYLARADLLRHREICADRTAVRWGADPRGWVFHTEPIASDAARARLRGFIELWRTHPSWELRRAGLRDPAQLFGVRALPMFLTGVAAMLTVDHLSRIQDLVDAVPAARFWMAGGAAILVTAVAGIALGRAVIYADITGDSIPSGWLAGLWLGAGLAAGELVAGELSFATLLPPRPWVLLLPVIAGILFGAWIVESTRLWARVWRGRSARPALALALIPAGLGGVVWFQSWDRTKEMLSQGVVWGSHQWRLWGFELPDHGWEQAATDLTFRYAAVISDAVAMPLAAIALWAIPFSACVIRRSMATPKWVTSVLGTTRADPHTEITLPTVRGILVPAVIGASVCWLSALTVQAYMHSWRPDTVGTQLRGFEWVDSWWLLITVVVGGTLAAALTVRRSTRLPLIIATLAGCTAALLGSAGIRVLVSADGCVRTLSIVRQSCGFNPRLPEPFVHFIPLATALVAVLACLCAGVADAVRAMNRHPEPTHDLAAPVISPGVPASPGSGPRAAIILVTVAALAIATFGSAQRLVTPSHRGDSNSAIDAYGPTEPVSVISLGLQVGAWGERGGQESIDRLFAILDTELAAAISETPDALTVHLELLPSVCTHLGQAAADAEHLFDIPDPVAQQLWKTLLSQAHTISRNCPQAIAAMQGRDLPNGEGDPSDPLGLLVKALFQAHTTLGSVLTQITEDIQAALRQS